MKQPACRWCGAPIEWVVVERTGRRLPVNPEPDELGTIVRVGRDWTGHPLVVTFSDAAGADAWLTFRRADDRRRWLPHTASCIGHHPRRRR